MINELINTRQGFSTAQDENQARRRPGLKLQQHPLLEIAGAWSFHLGFAEKSSPQEGTGNNIFLVDSNFWVTHGNNWKHGKQILKLWIFNGFNGWIQMKICSFFDDFLWPGNLSTQVLEETNWQRKSSILSCRIQLRHGESGDVRSCCAAFAKLFKEMLGLGFDALISPNISA